jgi:hypothetical protein
MKEVILETDSEAEEYEDEYEEEEVDPATAMAYAAMGLPVPRPERPQRPQRTRVVRHFGAKTEAVLQELRDLKAREPGSKVRMGFGMFPISCGGVTGVGWGEGCGEVQGRSAAQGSGAAAAGGGSGQAGLTV